MRRRSNLLVLLGLASFVLGLVAVYLITGDDDGGGGGGGDRVPVLVAKEDIAAGTLGDDMITNGQVEVIQVDLADRQLDALTSLSQLSGTRLVQLFPEGEQIRAGGVASIGGGVRAQIPEGFEAVALDIEFVAGGANTIAPGDRVNVFQTLTDLGGTISPDGEVLDVTGTGEQVKLLLTNVLVLDVQAGTPDLAISQASDPSVATNSPDSLIVIVAVDTIDAEKIIFGSVPSSTDSYRGLYLSRVRLDDDGNPPPPAVGDPAGRSLENILAEEAEAAFARSNP